MTLPAPCPIGRTTSYPNSLRGADEAGAAACSSEGPPRPIVNALIVALLTDLHDRTAAQSLARRATTYTQRSEGWNCSMIFLPRTESSSDGRRNCGCRLGRGLPRAVQTADEAGGVRGYDDPPQRVCTDRHAQVLGE